MHVKYCTKICSLDRSIYHNLQSVIKNAINKRNNLRKGGISLNSSMFNTLVLEISMLRLERDMSMMRNLNCRELI